MPRKAFAALATPTPIPYGKPRLAAPCGLNPAASGIWRQIVTELPPGYFGSDTGLLLERLCIHLARCRRFEALIAEAEGAPALDLDLYEKLTKAARAESAAAASLARALRLTIQSRHPVTAGRQAAMPPGPRGIEYLSGVNRGDE